MSYRYKKTKICKICKKEFHPTRKEYETCSKKCGCKIRDRKVEKRVLICDNCGKRFKRRLSKVRYEHSFCDRKCYAEYKQKNIKKERNPNWRGGISKKNLARHGKGNRLYRKGRYYENVARKELEKSGYYTVRSAASKGLWDVIAIHPAHIRLIQVKVNSLPRPKERDEMAKFDCPDIATKEFWRYFSHGKKEIWIYREKRGWVKNG